MLKRVQHNKLFSKVITPLDSKESLLFFVMQLFSG